MANTTPMKQQQRPRPGRVANAPTAGIEAAIRAGIADALERGDTLTAIADRAKIGRPNLSRWYHADNDIRLSIADRIAAAVGVVPMQASRILGDH